MIDSRQHAWFKLLQALQKRSEREKRQMFFAEGERVLEEAFRAHQQSKSFQLNFLTYLSEWGRGEVGKKWLTNLKNAQVPISAMSGPLFREVCDTETPQGALMVLGHRLPDWKDFTLKTGDFLLVADAIQDPGNFGTMIRTADAAGWRGALATRGTVDLYNPKVVRASAGSIFHLPVFQGVAHSEIAKKAEKVELPIYVMSPRQGKVWDTVSWERGAVVVVGNEGAGVSSFWEKTGALPIHIPMYGHAESLNAAIASAIVCFTAARTGSKAHAR